MNSPDVLLTLLKSKVRITRDAWHLILAKLAVHYKAQVTKTRNKLLNSRVDVVLGSSPGILRAKSH